MGIATTASLVALLLMTANDGEDINRHLYPKETRMVAIFDMAAIRQSGYFDDDLRKGFEQLVQSNEHIQRLSKLLSFDPAKNISGFTVCAGMGRGRNQAPLLIMNGSFPYEKLTAALAEMANKGELTSFSVQDLPVYFNHRNRNAIYFALVDHRTAIASPARPLIEDAIDGLTNLRTPKGELVARLDEPEEEKPAVVMAGFFPEEARRQMARAPQLAGFANDLMGYHVTVTFGDPNEVEVRLTLKSAESARTAAFSLKAMIELGKTALRAAGQRNEFQELMERIQIREKGDQVVVSLELSPALMKQLLARNREQQERFRQRQAERARQGDQKEPDKARKSTRPDSKDPAGAPDRS